MLPDVNYLAVIAAAAASFLLGGLWYSPAVFLKRWNRASGHPEERAEPHPPRVFAVSFGFALLAAFAFAWWLGPDPPLGVAMQGALVAGVGLVAACFGINYQFSGKSAALWLIDGGYHVAQFLLFGLVLGLWH